VYDNYKYKVLIIVSDKLNGWWYTCTEVQ